MKQATLFRAWNPKPSTSGTAPRHKVKPPDTSAEDVVVLSDDDDEFLVQAMDQTLASAMPPPAPPPQKALEDLPGFDVVAGQTWIYPTNYPVRDYQFNIVQSCLFKNTMVILPTGLGKTFIAAVVMYNFYRWYPTGKIVFTAPTKPLVAQQIEACYKIMGIPLEDTLEMTGKFALKRTNQTKNVDATGCSSREVLINTHKPSSLIKEKRQGFFFFVCMCLITCVMT